MRQSAQGKPLPEITEQTQSFWSAAHDSKLVMQRCARCETMNFYPKPWCIECGDRRLDWVEVRPTGAVYSYTTADVVMMNLPGWKADLPLTLCLVDLDDGPRMYAYVTHCEPGEVAIGMRVRAHFESISEEAGIPVFRPA